MPVFHIYLQTSNFMTHALKSLKIYLSRYSRICLGLGPSTQNIQMESVFSLKKYFVLDAIFYFTSPHPFFHFISSKQPDQLDGW